MKIYLQHSNYKRKVTDLKVQAAGGAGGGAKTTGSTGAKPTSKAARGVAAAATSSKATPSVSFEPSQFQQMKIYLQ
jgi:hypothetical protein